MSALDPTPDPHGVLAWINAIAETLKQAYAALLVPSAAAVMWLLKRRDERRSSDARRADERKRNEEEAHQRISDQLDQDSAERFAEMKADLAEERKSGSAKDAEINRQMGLKRRWFDHAHTMRTFAINKRPGAMPPDLSFDPDQP